MRAETEGQLIDGKQYGSLVSSLVGRLKVSSLKVGMEMEMDSEEKEA
jgi:hypothetical protein